MTKDDASDLPEELTRFTGEEGGDERATPHKDLGAAILIGVIAIFAMILSLRLEMPTSIYTAPGLLPFLTGLSLLAMAIGLGVGALRKGGGENYRDAMRNGAAIYLGARANRRTLILMVALCVYILIAGQISFDLRFPTSVFVFQFSSWEAISIPVLAGILRYFWHGAWWKCGLLSVLMIFMLAGIFRYAFHILLPAA